MATKVLFASPRTLSLPAAHALSPAESLAVVDIFINASIACICHTRELIPWDSTCFRTRHIDDLNSAFWKDNIDKYSAFCDTEPATLSVQSQEFRILKRGEDKRADGILDLIETGVFPALHGGFLEAVRFFITQGGAECDTRDVLESYTLNFSYNHNTQEQRSVRSVSLNSDHAFTTDNAIRSFKRAIKGLLTSLRELPTMPRKRSVGVAILYNNRCPPTYEAPGFLTEDVSLASKEHSSWHEMLLQTTGKVGEFEVGLYRVVIGASHIRPSVEMPTISDMRDLNTRTQLQGWQKSSSQQQHGLVSTLDDLGSEKSRNEPATNRLASDVCGSLPSSQIVSHSSVKKGSKRGRGSGNAPPAVPVMSRNSRKRNIAPDKLAELVVRARILQANRQGNHIFDPGELQQNKIVRLYVSLGSVMQCQCEDESSAGDLLLCIWCGTSQHMECYGWNGIPRVRLPDEHLCYSCLLLPQEAGLSAQMKIHVHKRLALSYVRDRGPTKATDLMQAMRLSNAEDDQKVFNDIVNEIQQEGYAMRSGATIMATTDRQAASNALRDFINPLASISHHFVAIKDGENESLRTNAIATAVQKYTQDQGRLPDRDYDGHERLEFREVSQRGSFYTDPEESRKRKASSVPIEETPSPKRTNMARKASYQEVTPSPDATPPPHPRSRTSMTRKASRCDALVRLDRSSPSTVYSSREQVSSEAVSVAISAVQWEAFASRGQIHAT